MSLLREGEYAWQCVKLLKESKKRFIVYNCINIGFYALMVIPSARQKIKNIKKRF